jgi:hypothetical protein
VVDTVAIKVYDQPPSGSANNKISNYLGDGITTTFDIGQTPNSKEAVIVKWGNDILDSKKYQIFKQSLIGDIINNPSIINNYSCTLNCESNQTTTISWLGTLADWTISCLLKGTKVKINKRIRTEKFVGICLNCSSEINRSDGKGPRKYCSSQCQQDLKKKITFSEIENGNISLYFKSYKSLRKNVISVKEKML